LAKKNVIITINHSPFTGDFCIEGLRAVVGTHLSIEEQQVKTVILGEGIYFALKDMKQDGFQKYLKTFKGMGMDIFLEEEALNERKLSREMISEEFKIIPREEILKLFLESDHVLAF
jgi:sulfur relay (sulfurtransferase) DsrF/TusC family protein